MAARGGVDRNGVHAVQRDAEVVEVLDEEIAGAAVIVERNGDPATLTPVDSDHAHDDTMPERLLAAAVIAQRTVERSLRRSAGVPQ